MARTRFAAYAWGVLGYTLFVILWGAFVRATGSGAGCGRHWPLCNGEVVPRAPHIETLVEFGHRLTSGAALLAVLGLAIWAWRAYPAGHRVRWAAGLSLAFILIEALIGAGLVLLELVAENASVARAWWMVAHLLNTFVLLAVLTLTAWWGSGRAGPSLHGRTAEAALVATTLLAVMAVGGTGAIAALGDTLFPAESLAQGIRDSFSPESHPLVRLRKLHPLLAVLVGAWVVLVARVVGRRRGTAEASRLAALAAGLYVVQLVAGAVNVVLLAPVWLQLLHLLLAELVWISLVVLAAVVFETAARTPSPQPRRSIVV